MRHFLALSLATLTLLASHACHAETREWTDKSGKFKIDAELVDVAGDVVRLRRPDGRTLSIPLAKLSTADREFINSLPVAGEDPALLASLVRVIVPLSGTVNENGEANDADEVTLVGFAIQTADPTPVIVVSRKTLPKNVEASDIDAALNQAKLLGLRSEDELGAATTTAGSNMMAARDGSLDAGRDGSVDAGRDSGGASAPAAGAAAAADASLIILRAATDAKIPTLALGFAPPAAGDAVTLARLPRPQVRAAGAKRPPIPWTSWTVLAGKELQTEFNLKPQDGAFPYAGATLPVLNAKKEVVGILNPGFKAMPDKTRAASAVGLGALRTALEQAGVQLPIAPPPPPALAVAPPPGAAAAGNMLSSLFSRLTGSQAAPPVLPPWRTNYETFASSYHAEMGRDGQWQIQWTGAPDFGAWYTALRLRTAASMQAANLGGRDSTGGSSPQAQQFEQAADQALAQLTGVEWTADVVEISTAPETPSQLSLPPLPEPLRINFVVEPQDAPNWSRVQPGDRVRFAVRFSSTELTDAPTITAYMTLKEATSSAGRGAGQEGRGDSGRGGATGYPE